MRPTERRNDWWQQTNLTVSFCVTQTNMIRVVLCHCQRGELIKRTYYFQFFQKNNRFVTSIYISFVLIISTFSIWTFRNIRYSSGMAAVIPKVIELSIGFHCFLNNYIIIKHTFCVEQIPADFHSLQTRVLFSFSIYGVDILCLHPKNGKSDYSKFETWTWIKSRETNFWSFSTILSFKHCLLNKHLNWMDKFRFNYSYVPWPVWTVSHSFVILRKSHSM